jgi:1-aminocyclopropane-1-carboxylate deaminase
MVDMHTGIMTEQASAEPVDDVSELHGKALQVPMEQLAWPLLNQRGIDVIVRRDDQVDEQLCGNKFYKLFFNIAAAKAAGLTQLASFGGAYSNHLHALAGAGKRYGLQTIGFVRGERPTILSPTLIDAQNWGMKLHFLSRELYRNGNQTELAAYARKEFGPLYLIPEGGANLAGCRGASAIGWTIGQHFSGTDYQVCIPCGTGTTLAGLAAGLPSDRNALGFSILKGEGGLGLAVARQHREIMNEYSPELLNRTPNWRLVYGFHGGGYGKKLPAYLLRFWREFELQTGLQLDPVYTLKMFWGIASLARQNYWSSGTRLVVVHTGGLQGRRGFSNQIDW